MPIVEGLIVLGIIAVVFRVLPLVIKGRQEHRKQRAELAAKQRSEETIETAIALLLADDAVAADFRRRLELAEAEKGRKRIG